MSANPSLKPYLMTARGGAVLSAEIVAVEPELCRDNKWRAIAITHAGARIELDAQCHDWEGAKEVCAMLVDQLFRYRVWADEGKRYAMGR